MQEIAISLMRTPHNLETTGKLNSIESNDKVVDYKIKLLPYVKF